MTRRRRAYFSATFWADTAERALKTLAQSLVAAQALDGLIDGSFMWRDKVLAALVGAGTSVLTSIASAPVGEPDSASLVGSVAE